MGVRPIMRVTACRSRPSRAAAAILALFAVAACSTDPTPPPAPVSRPVLLTIRSDPGGCRGVGIDATLHGSQLDPRVAWLMRDGRRTELIWPTGYTARFVPRLQILDASGRVVFVEGEHIKGACTAIDGMLTLRADPP